MSMQMQGWTPVERPASDVPILNEERPFLVFEEERLRAVSELAGAASDEARLEALLIINGLYDMQVSINVELGEQVNNESPDDGTARFWSWTEAWMSAAKSDWQQRVDEQNDLVARMDRTVAQRIVDDVGTPRLQQIAERAEIEVPPEPPRDAPPPAAPAAWYPDPSGSANWRWWDGTSWTEQSAPYTARSGEQSEKTDATPSVASESSTDVVPAVSASVMPTVTRAAHKRGTCVRCGGKLSLRQRLGEDLCSDCAPIAAEARSRYGDALTRLSQGAPVEGENLPALADEAYLSDKKVRELHDGAIRASLDRALADEVVTEDEEDNLVSMWVEMDAAEELTSSIIQQYRPQLVIAKANAGRLEDITDTSSVLVKKGEIVHLEVPAAQLKEVAVREYQAGYGGVSFRIAKGVSYRTGRVRGRSVVVGSEMQTQDTGILSVTSKRCVFVGARSTVEMPHAKLVGLHVYSDAVSMNLSNRKNAPLLALDHPDMVAAVINAATQEADG